MLAKNKIPAGLYAIHSILVKARWLTGQGVESKSLYQLLDRAELLPALIGFPDGDTTEQFREVLQELGKVLPECAGFLDNFDRDVSWENPGESAA